MKKLRVNQLEFKSIEWLEFSKEFKKKISLKTTVFILLSIFLFLSCNNNKKYKYIEIVEKIDVFGTKRIVREEPIIIKAANDSLALIDAFTRFQISLLITKEISKDFEKIYTRPKKFLLKNEDENNIANLVKFENRDSILNSIKKEVELFLKNTMPNN